MFSLSVRVGLVLLPWAVGIRLKRNESACVDLNFSSGLVNVSEDDIGLSMLMKDVTTGVDMEITSADYTPHNASKTSITSEGFARINMAPATTSEYNIRFISHGVPEMKETCFFFSIFDIGCREGGCHEFAIDLKQFPEREVYLSPGTLLTRSMDGDFTTFSANVGKSSPPKALPLDSDAAKNSVQFILHGVSEFKIRHRTPVTSATAKIVRGSNLWLGGDAGIPGAPTPRTLSTKIAGTLAEVYVINLDDRVDKCNCMQKQMSGSPWPVHRFSAIDRVTVTERCPLLRAGKEDRFNTSKGRANSALVCSNYLIWQRFLQTSSAQYLVIFEDDAIVVDPLMWEKLGKEFTSPCLAWDYLLVDPWRSDELWGDTRCGDVNLSPLDYGFSGSHMQVFTRAAVKAFAEFASGDRVHVDYYAVMDKFVFNAQCRGVSVKPFAVRANFTMQASMYMATHQGKDALSCKKNVWAKNDRNLLSSSSSTLTQPFTC